MSPACQHCYAESFAKRTGHEVWGSDSSPRRFFGDKHWAEPLRWDDQAEADGVRRRVFCASMADVFEDRPDLVEHRQRLWDLIERTPHLVWLLLTKRPGNVLAMVPRRWTIDPGNLLCDRCGASASLPLGRTCDGHRAQLTGWPANVWVGTTVEDQQRADERVPHLLQVPAPVRFLSCEPLLGPVTLQPDWLVPDARLCQVEAMVPGSPEDTAVKELLRAAGRHLGWRGVDWVIAGGESGGGSRPSHPDWFRSLRDQATAAAVPFLFKQWGDWRPVAFEDGRTTKVHVWDDDPGDADAWVARVGKKAAGRVLDGVTWDGVPPILGPTP